MEQEKKIAKIEAKAGLIAIFDILGFQSYINNDPDVGSQKALEVILKIKTEVPRKIKARINNNERLDDVTWSVLSDTIVLSIPYPKLIGNPDLDTHEQWITWACLLLSSIVLIDHMFDSGLPLRGAISYGKYFVNDQCLAGKSITDAISLAQRLNLSAVAICPEGESELRDIVNLDRNIKDHSYNGLFFPYLVPLKSEMRKLFVLNQWGINDAHDNDDISQLVAQAFWKHDKDMDESAFQKFRNTEMLLRYVIAMKRDWT